MAPKCIVVHPYPTSSSGFDSCLSLYADIDADGWSGFLACSGTVHITATVLFSCCYTACMLFAVSCSIYGFFPGWIERFKLVSVLCLIHGILFDSTTSSALFAHTHYLQLCFLFLCTGCHVQSCR